MKTRIQALVIGVAVLAAACGDDGGEDTGGGAGNGGGDNVAGVPAGKMLSALTDTDRDALCGELTSQINAFAEIAAGRKGLCLGAAASASEDQAMCETSLSTCEMELTQQAIIDFGGLASQEVCGGDVPMGCSATVGDFASCAQEALDVVVELGNDHTCESLTTGGQMPPEVSSRCESLLAECGG